MTDAQVWAAWFAAERDQQAAEHQADLAAIAAWQQRHGKIVDRLRALATELVTFGDLTPQGRTMILRVLGGAR